MRDEFVASVALMDRRIHAGARSTHHTCTFAHETCVLTGSDTLRVLATMHVIVICGVVLSLVHAVIHGACVVFAA